MKLAVLTLLLSLAGTAQLRTPATSDSANLPAYPIGPNDLLSVSIYGAPELSKTVRVSEEGFVKLPMLKARIQASGSLPSQVEAAIVEALEGEEILVEPVVTVAIAEYSSRPINVAGAVKQPLIFQSIGPVRLLDALSRAGGLSDLAGNDILVTDAAGQVSRIPVKQLLESSEPSLNVPLKGGEDIRVIEAGRAFVVGNVKKPGVFVLKSSADGTILQMLAMAEGLTPYASSQAYIYRRNDKGEREELLIELTQILRRKASDVAVKAEDIIYVPESRGRKLSATALERVLMFGSTAGATALMYGTVR